MTEKRSILFVHRGIGLGGAPKALRYIIEACVKAGHACSVATLECPDMNSYFKAAGAKVIVLDFLPYYSYLTSFSHQPGSKQFQEEREHSARYAAIWHGVLEKHGQFSLVFLNSMVLCDLIKPSQEAGCRVIQAVRETAQPGPTLEIMKGIIGKADAVLFISEYDRDLFSLDSTKVAVIPDAVDPALYTCGIDERLALRRKHGIGVAESVLLFTGGNCEYKGGELLLKSLCKVGGNNRLTLFYAGYCGHAGTKGLKSFIKTCISNFSRSPSFQHERIARLLSVIKRKKFIEVRIVGYRQDINEYFKVSDICAIPYTVPHQAMPIFEAGMAKIPCLVTNFPCFKDEVTDSDNGYLLPLNEPDAWARKIEELAEDPDKRRKMGESNYQRAMARHDINSNFGKLLSLINEVLSA